MMIRSDMRQLRRYRRARAVHPQTCQPRFLRAFDIQLQVIANIGDLGGSESQCFTGSVKDCRIGFGGAQLVRCDSHLKMVGQSDLAQVRCAIGQ